jgi:hypothetical protein
MTPTLEEYLASRSFEVTARATASQPGVAVREYENGEFRVHIVNERSSEVYVQVAPTGKPEQRKFLPGVVAFITGDESATRGSAPYAQWLTEHHQAIASFFSASPEGEAQRERYRGWERAFGLKEQARLAAAAAAVRSERKPWWKLW